MVGFQHDNGASEIIEIPLANIEFVIIPDNEASTMASEMYHEPAGIHCHTLSERGLGGSIAEGPHQRQRRQVRPDEGPQTRL